MKTAKIDEAEYVDEENFSININSSIYGFSGMSYLEGLGNAIDIHIDLDKEFGKYITLYSEHQEIREFYAPALLCGLGYLGTEELLGFLVEDSFPESYENENKT